MIRGCHAGYSPSSILHPLWLGSAVLPLRSLPLLLFKSTVPTTRRPPLRHRQSVKTPRARNRVVQEQSGPDTAELLPFLFETLFPTWLSRYCLERLLTPAPKAAKLPPWKRDAHLSQSFAKLFVLSVLSQVMKIIDPLAMLLALIGALLLCASCGKSGHTGKMKKEFSEAEFTRYSEAKEKALEKVLGPMHNIVGHAIIPFQVGGAVDMYYFPNGIAGTGFATMELIEPDGTGPKPNRIGTFELAAFTKLKMPPQDAKRDDQDPFNKIERRMCGILTVVGRYSYDAVLNPGETCEVPSKEGDPTHCLIFDEYQPNGLPFQIEGKKHCLLLCMEIFRSEMEYAMKNGSVPVLRKLKEKGHYPYSDLDREPVF